VQKAFGRFSPFLSNRLYPRYSSLSFLFAAESVSDFLCLLLRQAQPPVCGGMTGPLFLLSFFFSCLAFPWAVSPLTLTEISIL